MKVVIVGAGSVGLLLASFLSEQGFQTTLVVRRKEQLTLLQEQGLTRINLDQTDLHSEVNVTNRIDELIDDKNTLWIFAVKSHHLLSLIPFIQRLRNDTPLLFIQNGLTQIQLAEQLPQHHIAFGSLECGAEKLEETVVAHRGIGTMKIALFRGEVAHFQLLFQLNSEPLPMEWHHDAEEMLFRKALLNCFVNPLTALLRVKNGELIKRTHTYELLKGMYEELMRAFPEAKSILSFSQVEGLCIKTADNTSSMLGDLLHGRKMEVDAIVGGVILRAKARGQELPILSTLYSLLSALQDGGQRE